MFFYPTATQSKLVVFPKHRSNMICSSLAVLYRTGYMDWLYFQVVCTSNGCAFLALMLRHAEPSRARYYSRGPSKMPVELCRLPAIVPVDSLGTGGNNE